MVTSKKIVGVFAALMFVGMRPNLSIPIAPASQGKGVVTFTFDDAFENQYLYALPTMVKYRLRGTLYLSIEGMLDDDMNDPRKMNWAEVRAWKSEGWDIGTHTFSHPNLTKVDDERLSFELRYPQVVLKEKLGIVPTSFAFPFGEFNDAVVNATKKYYRSSAGVFLGTERHGPGMNSLPVTDRYHLSRLEVRRNTDVAGVCKSMDEAAVSHLWLILVMHGVVPDPISGDDGEYQLSRVKFEQIARCAGERVQAGVLSTFTVADVVDQSYESRRERE